MTCYAWTTCIQEPSGTSFHCSASTTSNFCVTTSRFRFTLRSIRFSISPALPRRCITSTIRCKRLRRPCTVRSTCWGWRSRVKAKILQASTSEVYGDPDVHPQREDYWGRVNPIGMRSCYDEGKRCAEALFFDYFRQHKLRIKVARIFNTYGPNMHPHDGRVVSNFITQALRADPITLYGDGQQTRSFCYVDDLIDGMVRLMRSPDDFTGPVNLGNPDEFTIRELAEVILEITGSRSKLVHKPLPARRSQDSQAGHKLGEKGLGLERQGTAS